MTATKQLLTVTKAPNAEGTFEGVIDANPPNGDKDNERIASWMNVPGEFPLGYQHAYGDPGANIGTASVRPKGDDRHLLVDGRLDLTSVMGRAVHERMLLPSEDSMALKELSVGFDYDRKSVEYDSRGVGVIEDAVLREVSVVYRGAQPTAISNVKDTEVKESTETRTLRNHLDSSHAQSVRAFKPPYADLVIKHRLLHANTAPVTERHITSGVPDGTTVPVTSVMDDVRRQSAARAASKDRARQMLLLEARLLVAREAAQRDALREQANANITAKLQADALSQPLAEWQAAENARDEWQYEKERQLQAARAAEREAEAAFREEQTQTMEDFRTAQIERDRKATEDLLAQDGPSFTMKISPTGQLEDV